ncbi:DUF4376 domain-containing protein [Chromobacterium amazonense]
MLYSVSGAASGETGLYFDNDKNAPSDSFPVSPSDVATVIGLPSGSAFKFDPPAAGARYGVLSYAIETLSDTQVLARAQTSQNLILQQNCQSAIIGGFTSSALGKPNHYGSLQTDQLNLQTMFAASQSSSPPSAYWIYCSPAPAQNPPLVQHTQAQMLQVLADLNAWRTAQQQKYATLVAQVQAAKTVADVQAVVWK